MVGVTIPSNSRDVLEQQGFILVSDVIDVQRTRYLADAFLDYVGPSPETNAYGILRNNVWTHVLPFEADLMAGHLAQLAGELLNCEEVICFQDNVICKVPGGLDPVEWHQDFSYWPLNSPDGITLWVALTDADLNNGCLKFVPGSHQLGERCPTNFVPGSNQPLKPELAPLDHQFANDKAQALPAQRGSVIAHHPLSWHSSDGNASNAHRIAWSITFLSPRVRWDPTHAPHPFNLKYSPQPGDPILGDQFPRFKIRLC